MRRLRKGLKLMHLGSEVSRTAYQRSPGNTIVQPASRAWAAMDRSLVKALALRGPVAQPVLSRIAKAKSGKAYRNIGIRLRQSSRESREARLNWVFLARAISAGVAAAVGCAFSSAEANEVSGAEVAPWKFESSIAVKEGYDSNVHLQSVREQANKDSSVTTVLPAASVAYSGGSNFNAKLSYAPEVAFFHSAAEENYAAHRFALSATYTGEGTKVETTHAYTLIDGSNAGPTWFGPGGAPAGGGPAIRDRRAAQVLRSSFRLSETAGSWTVRPGITGYVHDFQTEQRADAGYQNYADRNEFVLGIDVGRAVCSGLNTFLGYRYGQQDQSRVLEFPEEFDSHFHRVLFLMECKAAEWLKLAVSLGPEYRQYDEAGLPATFHERSEVNFYVDACATVAPTKADTVTASVKQFEQPGFSGRSVYEDLTLDLAWKHHWSDHWVTGLGGRAYNTDFLAPAVRNDWIYSGTTFLAWNVNTKLSTELSYVFERGESEVPAMAGREYTRHAVSAGIKYNLP